MLQVLYQSYLDKELSNGTSLYDVELAGMSVGITVDMGELKVYLTEFLLSDAEEVEMERREGSERTYCFLL